MKRFSSRWYKVLGIVGLVSSCVVLFNLHAANDEQTTGVGQSVYNARCAPCHGLHGDGKGPDAFLLSPSPRDFTAGVYEYRSTESGNIPLDSDIERTIKQGLPGTAMPAWSHLLRGDTLKAVIAYVKSFSPRFIREKPRAVNVRSAPAGASPERGRRVFERLLCASCHGADGTGKGAVASELRNDAGNLLRTPDLTKPWEFRGGSGVQDVFLRFRTGLDGTPMPSFAGTATEEEMWSLAAYVVSLGRKPAWLMNAEGLTSLYARQREGAKSDPVKRGKYLVDAIGCAGCHTPLNLNKENIDTLKYAGGQRWGLGPYGEVVSANLTSDSATGLGGRTDDQIRAAMTRGIRFDGSRMLPFPMPWTSFANLAEDDVDAIIAYLRTLPPVVNKIPPQEPRNVLSYLWGKFRMLILRESFAIHVYPENAGQVQVAETNGKGN